MINTPPTAVRDRHLTVNVFDAVITCPVLFQTLIVRRCVPGAIGGEHVRAPPAASHMDLESRYARVSVMTLPSQRARAEMLTGAVVVAAGEQMLIPAELAGTAHPDTPVVFKAIR